MDDDGPQPEDPRSRPHRAVLALGSNLGDRARFLRLAVDNLDALDRVVAQSQVFETDPVGGPGGQGPYLNMVVVIETHLDPLALLRRCQAIEEANGRQRTLPWGARTLDLDLLFYGDLTIDRPELQVPHPRWSERRFVLAPLAEVEPRRVPADWERTAPPLAVRPRGPLPSAAEPVVLRRLWPSPAEDVDVDALYADARRRPKDGRPWVLLNMVTTIDGATAVDGGSRGLGGPADGLALPAIRRLADWILVGRTTARVERYGPIRRPGTRIGVVTHARDVDASDPLYSSGVGVVVTTNDAPDPGVATLRAGTGDVDLAEALRHIGTEGARVVLVEGGPTLNAQLLTLGLVDEVCLTLAALTLGGESQRVAFGPGAMARWTLVHVAEADGELLLRYVRTDRAGPG